MPVYAKKRDKNEPAIIDALIEAGAHVTQLGDFGVPDLLVGFRGKTFLLEVKGELGPRGGGTGRDLTDAQKEWWGGGRRLRKHHKPLPPWADVGGPANIVRTPEEALAAIGAHVEPFERASTIAVSPVSDCACGVCESKHDVMALRLESSGGNHATAIYLCAACRAVASAVLVSR